MQTSASASGTKRGMLQENATIFVLSRNQGLVCIIVQRRSDAMPQFCQLPFLIGSECDFLIPFVKLHENSHNSTYCTMHTYIFPYHPGINPSRRLISPARFGQRICRYVPPFQEISVSDCLVCGFAGESRLYSVKRTNVKDILRTTGRINN
jgi:hypothetical protein